MRKFTVVHQESRIQSSFEASGPIVAKTLARRWLSEQVLPGNPAYVFALLLDEEGPTQELRIRMAKQTEVKS